MPSFAHLCLLFLISSRSSNASQLEGATLLHQWCTPQLAWARTLWGRRVEGKEDRYGSGSTRLLMNFSHACWHSRCQMGIDCTHARQPACEKRLRGKDRMGGNRQVSILLSANMPMFVLMVFIILLVHQSVQTAGMIVRVSKWMSPDI